MKRIAPTCLWWFSRPPLPRSDSYLFAGWAIFHKSLHPWTALFRKNMFTLIPFSLSTQVHCAPAGTILHKITFLKNIVKNVYILHLNTVFLCWKIWFWKHLQGSLAAGLQQMQSHELESGQYSQLVLYNMAHDCFCEIISGAYLWTFSALCYSDDRLENSEIWVGQIQRKIVWCLSLKWGLGESSGWGFQNRSVFSQILHQRFKFHSAISQFIVPC